MIHIYKSEERELIACRNFAIRPQWPADADDAAGLTDPKRRGNKREIDGKLNRPLGLRQKVDFVNTGERTFSKISASLRAKSKIIKTIGCHRNMPDIGLRIKRKK